MLCVPSYPLVISLGKVFFDSLPARASVLARGQRVIRLCAPLLAAKRSRGPRKTGERGAYCFWPTLSLLGLLYEALFLYSGPMARKILFLPEEIVKDSRELDSVAKAGGVSLSSVSFPSCSGVDLCLLGGGTSLISGMASCNLGLNFCKSSCFFCRMERGVHSHLPSTAFFIICLFKKCLLSAGSKPGTD